MAPRLKSIRVFPIVLQLQLIKENFHSIARVNFVTHGGTELEFRAEIYFLVYKQSVKCYHSLYCRCLLIVNYCQFQQC